MNVILYIYLYIGGWLCECFCRQVWEGRQPEHSLHASTIFGGQTLCSCWWVGHSDTTSPHIQHNITHIMDWIQFRHCRLWTFCICARCVYIHCVCVCAFECVLCAWSAWSSEGETTHQATPNGQINLIIVRQLNALRYNAGQNTRNKTEHSLHKT